MSQRVVRYLHEVLRHGGAVVVRCQRCNREARFHPGLLGVYFRHKRWSDYWPDLAKRFRCAGPKGCGARAALVFFSPGLPDEAKGEHFTELPSPAPIGVPQWAWNRARTEGERKSLIRRARG